MLEKTVESVDPCEQSFAKSRCRKIMWFFLCGLGVLALISVVWWLVMAGGETIAQRNQTSAYLRIAMAQPTMIPSPAQYVQFEYDTYKNTQKQLLLNRLVLNAALHKTGIIKLPTLQDHTDSVDWLTNHLQVTFPDNAEIMQVSVSGANRKERAMLVNAVVDAYLAEVVDAERSKRAERISELKGIQIGKMQEVKDALNDLRKMADSLGTSESDTLNLRQKNILDELAALRNELIPSQFELNRMNIELASQKALLQTLDSAEISDIECQQSAATDAILKKLGEELLEREIAADVKDQAKLERLKKKYSERFAQIREEIKHKSLADAEKEIKKLEAAINVASKQQEIVREEFSRLRKEADHFGQSSIDMQMRRAVNVNSQKSLDNITAELERLSIEAKAEPRVTVILKPEVPE